MKEHIYYVRGMHCPSCEVLIEKILIKFNGIKSVSVSLANGQALVEYENELPNIGKLNSIFAKYGYTFYNHPPQKQDNTSEERIKPGSLIIALVVAFFLFIVLPKTKLAGLVSVSNTPALPAFFAFGLLAGLSSCAALVGGIVLSMSKTWGRNIKPHLMFNTGRLIAYTLFGGILGLIGSSLRLSPTASAVLVIIVSAIMFLLGLQMIGIRALQKFRIAAPKNVTRFVANESNFKQSYMSFVLGALTFILPCGFTITVQSLALISGSFVQGALILLFFALGTLPMLLIIGFSSVKLLSNTNLATQFLKTAGVIVVLFAVFNINSQLNLIGTKSLSDISRGSPKSSSQNQNAAAQDNDLPPIVDGKQIVKMEASASGYSPNKIKVRSGIPIKWEITDTGTSGCTNALISKSLFSDTIELENGQTVTKEFTISKAGKYKFSCWMGMISGTIEAV